MMQTQLVIKQLKWRKPTDHPSEHEDDQLTADGIGGKYSISKRQKIGAPYLLWMSWDEFVWKGFPTVKAAKNYAQRDFSKAVRKLIIWETVQ